jgi:hypothetical protein
MFFITNDGLTSFNLRDILHTEVLGLFHEKRMNVYFTDNPNVIVTLRNRTDIDRMHTYLGEHQWIAESEK